MERKTIKSIALALVLSKAITLTGCTVRDEHKPETNEPTAIVEVDDKIRGSNDVLYDRTIDVYKGTFKPYEHNASAVTFSIAAVYDLDGNYLMEVPEGIRATIVAESKEQRLFIIKLESGEEVIIEDYEIYEAPNIENTNFYDITEDNNKIVVDFNYLYDEEGKIVGFAYENYECTAIKTNGEYTLVRMGQNGYSNSDNVEGYIENSALLSKFNQYNFYAYANADATAYCDKGLTREAYGYDIKKGQRLEILFIADKYACMSIEDHTNVVYIPAEVVDVIDRNIVDAPTPTPETWFEINAYHYVSKNAYLFGDTSFNNPGTLIEEYQKVYVISSSADWSYVMTDDGEYGYMEPYLLYLLPNDYFVEIDVSDQTTTLYYEQKPIFSTPCVTGKDETPSDYGYFDIDDKAEGTYLSGINSHGNPYSVYVDYWMPYNYGEGLHDAPWQNGHYGDKTYYHTGGSEGCDNMPPEAAKYIYDKVNVGTMVLSHK